jgi:hypothetical protein
VASLDIPLDFPESTFPLFYNFDSVATIVYVQSFIVEALSTLSVVFNFSALNSWHSFFPSPSPESLPFDLERQLWIFILLIFRRLIGLYLQVTQSAHQSLRAAVLTNICLGGSI